MAHLTRFVLCVAFSGGLVRALEEPLKVVDTFDFFDKNVNVHTITELLIPTSSAIQNERCRNHSLLYWQELKKFRLWATEMFDATTKFPSGILEGSTYGLGNFDECVRVKVPLVDGDEFSGKYCLAKIKIEPPRIYTEKEKNIPLWESDYLDVNVSTWEKILSLSKDRSKRLRNEIHWSFCIPSSCTEKDLEVHLQEMANFYNELQDFNVSVSVSKNHCQVKPDHSLDAADITFLSIVLVIVIIILGASGYHLLIELEDLKQFRLSDRPHEFLTNFSLVTNIKKIFRKTTNSDGLDCIHGMKVVSMFLVIMGHRIMFVIGSPLNNSSYIEGFYGKIEAMVLLNGPIIVDTFFNISGFLATYLMLCEYEKRGKTFNAFILYMHRLIRLTPLYVVVLAFYCTLFIKMGSGPLWLERIGVERERCLASWWANLLYINNYVNTDKICMFQSWFITCDWHFFIITPWLAMLLWKKPKIGLFVSVTIIVLAVVSTFVVAYVKELDAILLLYMKVLKDPIADRTFRNIYIPTHTRASPYFVGVITGYIKYKMNKDDVKFPKIVTYIGWIVSVLLLEVTVYSAYFFYIPNSNYNSHVTALYASFHHFIWSICISWFILALSSGNGEWVEPILAWHPLKAFSRVTYAAFLVHGGIQLYSAAILRDPFNSSIFILAMYTAGDIIIAYVVGFLLCLFFESPIIGIERILLQRDRNKQRERKNLEANGDLYLPKITMISNNVAA